MAHPSKTVNGMRPCSRCKESKPVEEYRLYKDKKTGKMFHRGICKKCENKRARDWRVEKYGSEAAYAKKLRFNLTPEQFAAKWEAQGRKCSICGIKPDSPYHIVVDHCHRTNKVRDILCKHCNAALGSMRDNPDIAIKMAEYLEKHKERR